MNRKWFQLLFGFEEGRMNDMLEIQRKFVLSTDHSTLTSLHNQRVFQIGHFTTPTIAALRDDLRSLLAQYPAQGGGGRYFDIRHVPVSGAMELHAQYPNAVIQAASQFNCLEFPSFEVIPEQGITEYIADRTQGPACAVACAAGTLYRNYFVPIPNNDDRLGQSRDCQLNNLDELEIYLQNDRNHYFYVRNGYTFSDPVQLTNLNAHFRNLATDEEWDECRKRIKIGLHKNVGVTFDDRGEAILDGRDVRVTQVYCSAISCAYSGVPTVLWEPLATLVLEAMYEGTILAAVINMLEKEHNRSAAEGGSDISNHNEVFLTFVGGGVFGNKKEWIADAIGRAVALTEKMMSNRQLLKNGGELMKLRVNICHYRQIDPITQQLITQAYQKYSNVL